uniref:Uncharacterized protein n=1 Tax=Schistocephalus solidus TaxID=70667 RepID=A0A0X3PEF5_SCHSO
MTTGPKAPRAERKHRDQSMKEEATQVQTTPPIEQQQQQHQYAPLLISRPRTAPQPPAQTEYQRAYSPPPNYAYTRPAHPCLPHADNLGQQSRITRQTPTKQYSTELRKPVSTSYQPRRAHSTSLLDKHRPHRDQACSPRQSPHRSCSTYYTQPYHADRYLSEYQAKFRNFSDLPLSSEQTINAYSLALDERLSAARRRGVTEDSHFSRDHLGQLKSNALWLWDSRGSARNTDFSQGTRDAGQMLQNYQLPPAGMPSSPNETSALKATIAPRVPAATREVFPLRPFTQQTATRFGSPKAEIGRSRRPLSQKLQNRKAGIYTTSVSPVRNINSARRFSSPLAEVERHGKIWGSRTSESPLRNITISSARALPTCCLRRRHRVLKSRLRPWNPTQISTLNSSEQKTSCVGLFGMDLPRCRSPASEFATITSLAPKAYDATKYSDWEDSSLNSWRSFSDQKASIGLAVRTLERARQRRNQVLISSCRSPQFEKYWSSTHAETEPQRLCLT